ncbi:DUF2231 domain-containing protein [Brevundimonas sp.]
MTADHPYPRSGPNALHAILLGFPIALFSANLVTDITYLRTAEIQWTNFSAWLNAGGLVFGGLVLVWALASLLLGLAGGDRLRRLIYAVVLALMCVVGLINAFQHSRDGWSSVGTFGLILSIVTVVLALAAGVIAHSNLFSREVAR